MWKKINSILKDKNDYHLDPELKRDSEIAEELFQNTIKYHKYLIPKKIKYFFQHDKSFFVKLFIRYFLKLFGILVGISIFVLLLLFIFGININVKKTQKAKINYTEYPIYIPSSGNIVQDSLKILNYKKIFKDAKYVIFYPKDTTKDYNKWKDDLHGIESNDWVNPYEARRDGSQYWGKYQMGEAARKEVGMGNINWEKWKNNPDLQEAALKLWVETLYSYLKDEIRLYDGQFLNGWSITESGIIAMAHNVGPEPTKQFLRSGGKIVPKDGSGKDATRFLILGNYDLNI
ncbi:hypothetical protein M0Q97_12350, partial [Candidatus Dojkabacteria bacterium]|nr:hypothetical protein [Candidatus Dojkabacteria bacterium]